MLGSAPPIQTTANSPKGVKLEPAPTIFPHHRSLALDEATKMLLVEKTKSTKIEVWYKPYLLELIEACKDNNLVDIFIGSEIFTLKSVKSKPAMFVLSPSNGDFVPMAYFSLEDIEREFNYVTTEDC